MNRHAPFAGAMIAGVLAETAWVAPFVRPKRLTCPKSFACKLRRSAGLTPGGQLPLWRTDVGMVIEAPWALAHWRDLFANFGLVTIFAVLWTSAQDLVPSIATKSRSILIGVFLGIGAVVSMTFATALVPGVFFDLRSTLVSLAGFFGGPPAALLSGSIAVAFRIWRGGAGVVPGTMTICLACLVGYVGRRLLRDREVRLHHLVLLGICIGLIGVPSPLVFSEPLASVFLRDLAVPLSCLNAAGTLIVGLIILGGERRRNAAEANGIYRSIIEALPDSLNVKDLDGRFIAANPATARLMRATSITELIGKSDFSYYPADVAEQFRADERAAMLADGPTVIEQHVSFSDGSSAWLSTLKTALRDGSGKTIALITHNRDITETKRLQDDLLQTQRRLDGALAHMSSGLALFDEHGVLLLCNDRYRTIFPVTADLREPGTRLREILRAAVQRGEEICSEASVEGWIDRCEAKLFHDNDHTLPLADGRRVEMQTRLVEGVGSLVVMADVTSRVLADEKLRAAEAEYRALFENAVSGIYRSSPDGKMVRANPALVKLNGYDSEAELIAAVEDIAAEWYVDPRRRDEFIKILRTNGRVDDFVSEIYRHRTRERIWISETAWTVAREDQGLASYEGTVIEANERKQAEALVKASEARYRLLADNIADLILLLTEDGNFAFVSPASREILGYEPAELTGKHVTDIVHVSDRPKVRLALGEMDAGTPTVGVEFRARRQGGEVVWVEMSGRPLDQGRGCVLAVRDIASRKKAEEDLAAAIRQLELAASVDVLTGLASRRAFEEAFERAFSRCSDESRPLSLLLIDVDNFKAYNDTYGHLAGDDCLRRLGRGLLSTLGSEYLAARYGGEEFVVILPGLDLRAAAAIGETYAGAVRGLALAHSGSKHGLVTVSIGASTVNPKAGAQLARDLVGSADDALYIAKERGRNNVATSAAA